jgi:hypothetical protein
VYSDLDPEREASQAQQKIAEISKTQQMEAQNIEGKVDQKADSEGQNIGSIIKNIFSKKQKVGHQIDATAAAAPPRPADESLEDQRLYNTNQYKSNATDTAFTKDQEPAYMAASRSNQLTESPDRHLRQTAVEKTSPRMNDSAASHNERAPLIGATNDDQYNEEDSMEVALRAKKKKKKKKKKAAGVRDGLDTAPGTIDESRSEVRD